MFVIAPSRQIRCKPGYCIIVPDRAAGKRNRFTVYHIPSSPSMRVRIIGRELPIGLARTIARQKLGK